jgi:hypothetical protein
MLNRVMRRLGKYLVELSEEKPAPSDYRRSKQSFERRGHVLLEAKQKSNERVTAGAVELIGLDDIKRELGATWPEVAGRASSIAEEVIRQHLTSADVYTEQDDGTFVLVFAEQTKQQATETARKISGEIKTAIKNQIPRIADSLGVRHFVAEVDNDVIFTDDKDRPLADALFESLSAMRREAEEGIQQRRATILREARVVFRPVWHSGKRAVMLFRCMFDAPSGAQVLELLEAIPDPDQLISTIMELDILIFGKGIKSLHEMLQRQAKAIMVVPLSFHTAADKRSLDEYLRLCRGIPQAYKKFIFVELTGTPAGTPMSRISGIAAALQPYCHAVLIENTDRHHDVSDLADANVSGVTFEMSGAPHNATDFSAAMKRASNIAKARNLTLIVHGVNTIGQLDATINLGIDYLDGEAVHVSLDEPRSAFKYSPLAS